MRARGDLALAGDGEGAAIVRAAESAQWARGAGLSERLQLSAESES